MGKEQAHTISVSGGKDSAAMLLGMVERGKKPFYGTKSVRDLEERFKKEDEKEKE